MDNVLITGEDKDELFKLKRNLSQTFDMKNLKTAKYVLAIRIVHDRSNGCIYLSQSEYLCKILKRFNIESAKPLNTPLSMHVKLGKDECSKSNNEMEFMRNIPY